MNNGTNTHTNRKGVIAMSKKIAQVLVVELISCLLIALPATARTAKQPAPGSTVSTSQVVKVEHESSTRTIKDVQEVLNKEGYKLKVDGLIGRHTRAAIEEFQKIKGLAVTGKPDEATLAKLNIK